MSEQRCPKCGSPEVDSPSIIFECGTEIRVRTFQTPLCRMLELEAALAKANAGKEAAEDVLRSLACWLSAGGYNAPTVDPDVFEQKIRAGVDMLVNPLTESLAKATAENERLRLCIIEEDLIDATMLAIADAEKASVPQ